MCFKMKFSVLWVRERERGWDHIARGRRILSIFFHLLKNWSGLRRIFFFTLLWNSILYGFHSISIGSMNPVLKCIFLFSMVFSMCCVVVAVSVGLVIFIDSFAWKKSLNAIYFICANDSSSSSSSSSTLICNSMDYIISFRFYFRHIYIYI